MTAYYNERDRFAAAWLRALIEAGQIAPGIVDERDIREIKASDLEGYAQVHLFAGIGGWSYALRLAGWPDDRPVWTGSCPCQPFSAAGKRKAEADERHLWPAFLSLIAECRPATVFGEQVAGRLGLEWLAGVRADLERIGYAIGAADLPAACVGAPHIRQRLFWVADARQLEPREHRPREGTGADGAPGKAETPDQLGRCCGAGGLGDADESRSQRRDGGRDCADERTAGAAGVGCWSDFDLIPCRDGKARRVESGTFPLAHGIPGRVGRLRGYGNAIVPQVAAAFVKRKAADMRVAQPKTLIARAMKAKSFADAESLVIAEARRQALRDV